MKLRVQIIIEQEGNDAPTVEEVACLCRGDLLPESLGLTLEEGKQLLANIQKTMITHQASEYIEQQRNCPDCGKRRGQKGKHELVYRSLFGKLWILSPRLYHCPCRFEKNRSFSPLAAHLPERTAPELHYLQSKWASLMSYGLTVDLLAEVLPMQTNPQTILLKTHEVAERIENELGNEELMLVEGVPREWEELPEPEGRMTVGIDGGYIHARDEDSRKAGGCVANNVGKSQTDQKKQIDRFQLMLPDRKVQR